MKRFRRNGSPRTRKIALGAVLAVVAGGAVAVGTGMSHASTTCDGLDEALQRNLSFMADQQAHPNAQTDAVLANRQAVVDLINVQRRQAGCTGQVAQPAPAKPTRATTAPTAKPPVASTAPAAKPPAATGGTGAGEVVCKGSTVTLSGEAGAPFASSGTFPIGTRLKVTNLDNNKSITVTVQSTSGSCVLLNNAAFEQVREAGKFLIRRAVIERVG
ncbi:hypothetical protein ACWT_8155 [Actinoplanes sp. SE50]|uniref:hypothetical protein n=1 Tax=unclassified Actinoplanes TaxID=2626549 RepID=UPI00023EDD62|nr:MULTISPECIES: hypothetical protein [unclassified Actinoplanes]AEV89164.1 putative 23.9 kDa protein in glnII region [Actinoplanes sp. SE50/110]ATO87570.1 hypothetical protein ACWT_8155 [Actinoplanes sp. SE50]SLM04988.1 hypothetical protein ACSP50_8303 [Actinoplanes sp. SE50/110]